MTGYYRKFVKNYGRIAAPLTTLINKDLFSWTPDTTKDFEHIKEAMCQAPVLATPDFTKTFIVECDASGNGIIVVLMQDERRIAFESRPIKGKFLSKAIYEKEMLAILHALKKWRYNTSFHTTTKMTPFMALYGYQPPSITSYLRENSKVQAVEDHVEHQQQVL